MIELIDFHHLTPEEKLKIQNMMKTGWLPGVYAFEWDEKDIVLIEDASHLIAVRPLLEDIRMGELRSLFVASPDTFASKGHSLLAAMENELIKREMKLLSAVYPARTAATESLDKLLHSAHWNGPTIVMIECAFDPRLFHPKWFEQSYQLPPGFALFPWSELTHKAKNEIIKLWHQAKLTPDVYPFLEKKKFERSNSFGLRHKGRVVGWCLTEAIEPGTLWFPILYVAPPYRATGVGIQLLARSIQRIDTKRFPLCLFKVNLLHVPMRWLRFVKKRLIPYAQWVTHYIQMWHKF